MSPEGQRILFEPGISRLPAQRDMYVHAPKGFPNPFDKELLAKGLNFDIKLSRQRYNLVNTLFDTMITFRVKKLNHIWEKIYQAESLLENNENSMLSQNIQEARHLISTIPVSRKEMLNQEFTSIFRHHKSGITLPAKQLDLELAWKQFAQGNLEHSEAVVQNILTQIQNDIEIVTE